MLSILPLYQQLAGWINYKLHKVLSYFLLLSSPIQIGYILKCILSLHSICVSLLHALKRSHKITPPCSFHTSTLVVSMFQHKIRKKSHMYRGIQLDLFNAFTFYMTSSRVFSRCELDNAEVKLCSKVLLKAWNTTNGLEKELCYCHRGTLGLITVFLCVFRVSNFAPAKCISPSGTETNSEAETLLKHHHIN